MTRVKVSVAVSYSQTSSRSFGLPSLRKSELLWKATSVPSPLRLGCWLFRPASEAEVTRVKASVALSYSQIYRCPSAMPSFRRSESLWKATTVPSPLRLGS